MHSALPAKTAAKPAAPSLCPFPWTPDNGDGTFTNPILCADYSDPDVVRHGDDFYLTASSFNCTPGLPILHSRDLVNWTLINHAVENLPHPRYSEVQPGCGVWAPAIRHHAGKFWIFFPMPDEGIYMTTAEDPRGKWTEPHLVQAGRGLIDPCPFWDDDGKAYLVHAYARSRSGVCDILRVRPMEPDGSKLLGEGQVVFHVPEKHPTIEGPKFLKRDGWYYILAPAGGVATGWQVALRSKNIFGPYEDKVVLESGGTAVNGPHQGALVDSPGGDWWFVHFQDVNLYGRIVHLQPVVWRQGWPLMGVDQDGNGIGEPVTRHRMPVISNRTVAVPQTSDEFDLPGLGRQWQWQANHKTDWFSLAQRKGWLRLFAQPAASADLGKTPHLLSQKVPARSFKVETLLTLSAAAGSEEAGLALIGRKTVSLALRQNGSGNEVVLRDDGTEKVLSTVPSGSVRLRMTLQEGGVCEFTFAADGGELQPVPGSFQAVPGVWIGAKVGIYCLNRQDGNGGHADFDYFRFSPA